MSKERDIGDVVTDVLMEDLWMEKKNAITSELIENEKTITIPIRFEGKEELDEVIEKATQLVALLEKAKELKEKISDGANVRDLGQTAETLKEITLKAMHDIQQKPSK